MDSHVNHHIKATYSGFYFLGSLHFAYIGQTYASGTIQQLFLTIPSGRAVAALRDAAILRDAKLLELLSYYELLPYYELSSYYGVSTYCEALY